MTLVVVKKDITHSAPWFHPTFYCIRLRKTWPFSERSELWHDFLWRVEILSMSPPRRASNVSRCHRRDILRSSSVTGDQGRIPLVLHSRATWLRGVPAVTTQVARCWNTPTDSWQRDVCGWVCLHRWHILAEDDFLLFLCFPLRWERRSLSRICELIVGSVLARGNPAAQTCFH